MTEAAAAARARLMELICEHISPGDLRLIDLRDSILAAYPILSLAPGKDVVEGACELAKRLIPVVRAQTWDFALDDAAEMIAVFATTHAAKERADGIAEAIEIIRRRAQSWTGQSLKDADELIESIRARSTP